ncbi:MAG TPA: hypothetical protein VJ949_13635, partial [Cryomorphaceae bacterium]|nr:hypothetical protein [Cryomorphaceae bacterium]
QAALAELHSSSLESASESSEMINASAEIWNSLIGSFQWDTAGVYPAEEVMALLEQYPPVGSTGKFASALAAELEVSEPEWITDQNSFLFEAEMISVSADENGDLPYDLTAFKDEYDFSNAALVASLNEQYAAHDQSYVLHLEMPEDQELPASFGTDDEGKSNHVTESPSAISIMPNPFDENFTLSLSTSKKYTTAQVVFHDLLGRRIAQSVHGNISRLEIDGSEFPSGVLIYSVHLDGELFDTGRIVKSE